ncbi:Uncharacterised protein [Bordetella ansorpii]|uniref:DUF4350 domain-containing protein n=1 Tax=Bordetella ansorpii TaxID=288768 RepID=A0A157RH82_9BORD|nr:hypothetical protein [Bordetella ansorpii]SAI57351.1 Uncharacterised protein [Bordetella ansorpii]
MSLSRKWTVGIAVIVLLLGVGGWWGARNLDRLKDDRPRELPFFADNLHVTQELVHRLGAKVVTSDGFDPETPRQARVVVADLGDEADSEQVFHLAGWVRRGGHLVVFGSLDGMTALPGVLLRDVDEYLPDEDENSEDGWDSDERDQLVPPPAEKLKPLPADKPGQTTAAAFQGPVLAAARADDEAVQADDEDADPPIAEKGQAKSSGVVCRQLVEVWPEASGTYGSERAFKACGWPSQAYYVPIGERDPTWALQGEHGIEMMRVAVGSGSVTVIGTPSFMYNGQALIEDNPLVLAAALQVRPDSEVWFVDGLGQQAHKPSPSLSSWLWNNAWVAVLIALLAAAAAVWRSATRFGPVMPPGQANRRSMGDQVRGTGQYLRGQGAAALHAAQVRALHEAAARVLPQYTALSSPARVQAISRATRMDAESLERALVLPGEDARDKFESELALLEAARRRLLEQADARRSSHPPPST